MSDKIKYVLIKRKKKITDFAKEIGMSQSNFSNKLSRDDFRESELQTIAEALDCDLDPAAFILRDTGERV